MSVVQTLIGNVKGPQGERGAQGEQGAQGNAATISVGSVTTVPYGQNASVMNSGTDEEAVLDFRIPQGRPGDQVTQLDNLVLNSITEPSTQFPIPAIGDIGSVLFGKISKWFGDMTALVATKLNAANVVNNLTTTSSGYALDARQGKILSDTINNKGSFKITVPVSPAVTIPANGDGVVLDNTNLSSYGTFHGAIMQWCSGGNCVSTNCQGNSSAMYLRVKNLSSTQQSISQVVLMCFKN